MTQEEKAKAYDEALKKLHEIITMDNHPVLPKEIGEFLFPQLTESEKEKMCKAAMEGIEYLEHNLGWDAIGDIDILDVKEYLEKQKEHPTNEEMLRTLRAEYEKGVADTIAKYEQEEQEPAEWSDSVAKEMFIKALERAVEQTKKGYELTDCDKHAWWEDFKAYSEKSRQWKPGKEQVNALWKLMHNAVYLSSWGELEKQIESLYNDLKKL